MINTPFNVGDIFVLKDAYFQVTRYEPGRLRLKEIPADEVIAIARKQFEERKPDATLREGNPDPS